MSTPILCNNEEITLQKKGLIHWQDELILKQKQKNWYLRVYADKEGGIAIDDCVLISRSLEEKLDAEDFIEDAYILEVSSPGLGRPLKKEKDYVRSVGKSIDIKLYKAIDKQKEFTGILKENMEDQIVLTIEDQDITFEKKSIASARLSLDF